MKFECGDLDRALAVSELMPEAREHLKHCAVCRREYRVWSELSAAAKGLHEEWETPLLWPAIRRGLEAEEKLKPKPLWKRQWNGHWKSWVAVAAGVVVAMSLLLWMQLFRSTPGSTRGSRPANKPAAKQSVPLAGGRDFLTEQALAEVERTEAAYRRSIDKLSVLAAPRLDKAVSAVNVSYREKLLMLDSAISETRGNLDQNRFNVRLRMDLAALYREKQQTLKELLTGDQKKN